MSSTDQALDNSILPRPLSSPWGSIGPHQPLLSRKVQEDPLERVSYAALGGFMNLKDPTPPFLYSDQSFIHLYQGLNAFSLPVIYTQEEKKPQISECNCKH